MNQLDKLFVALSCLSSSDQSINLTLFAMAAVQPMQAGQPVALALGLGVVLQHRIAVNRGNTVAASAIADRIALVRLGLLWPGLDTAVPIISRSLRGANHP